MMLRQMVLVKRMARYPALAWLAMPLLCQAVVRWLALLQQQPVAEELLWGVAW